MNRGTVAALAVVGIGWLLLMEHSAQAHSGGNARLVGDFDPRKLSKAQTDAGQLVAATARKYAVPVPFALALAFSESSFRPEAKGDDGKSLGLFQLTLATASRWQSAITEPELLAAQVNANLAMQELLRSHLRFPHATFGDYAEAWTLGLTGKFIKGRSNLQKRERVQTAINILGISLDLGGTWA